MLDHLLPSIPGYTLTAQLYAGSHTAVYRAISDCHGESVVIKVLRSPYPNFRTLVRFRNQYIIAKNLAFPGIVKPLALVSWHHSYALVMEDVWGINIQDYVKTHGRLSIEQVMAIAIQLANSLHHLSQERVLHKDINPANILIHPDTHQVWLTDFSLASLLPKESQELQSPGTLEGTLAYIAPEQTGRMNRGIDYRADFYSLGVTLYELLTGELPFQSDDPMKLIHCHIAKAPMSPCEVYKRQKAEGRDTIPNSPIPKPLSDIVLKLMAKNAEDRYQSALGIKHDLQLCLYQWQVSGKIEQFVLGERDLCDRFLIPEKLYGREKEVQSLLDAFERVASPPTPLGKGGGAEMMLVAGYSGIGKTAVVNEVHKPITRQKGYLITGKFDQFNRNIPFSAFVIAFRDLMGQLLGESDIELQKWKGKILEAVGEQGQVLIDVIPELQHIIGQQPPVPELSGNAAQNRFNLLFEKFIAVFTTIEHPLTLFLDDLQWADSASLNLLKVLMGGTRTEYLLLLGAYRDNEVFPAHPLMLTLAELEKRCDSASAKDARERAPRKQNATISTITLAPLSVAHINQLVAETLSCSVELATPLTDLVYQKTKGNPFFTTQFLKGLYEDELITFNQNLGYWECDLVQVREAALTSDVVEFMAGRLHKLPDATQEVLKLAACIGNQFDLETLAIICEAPSEEVAANLWSALQSRLILPQSEAYKFFQGMEDEDQSQNIPVSYHFLHDRVQQAAYSLIQNERKQITHLNIGRLLLQTISPGEQEKNLFKIVNQLNMGISLIEQPKEREELAQLNLVAARKAKSSAAYNAAASYLNIAIELLHTEIISAEPWQTHYELMLPLHNLLAEVSYLNGEYEASQQQTQTIIDHAKDILEQVKAYEIRISLSVAQGQCLMALDVGLEILSLLNVSLDDAPLPDIDIDRLYILPAITSPQIIAALSILSKLWAPAFIANPQLLPSIILTMLNLSVSYGNSATAAFAYSLYGMLLCGKMTDIELGYSFGQLALHTLERYEDAELTCKVNQLFHAFIRNWKEPARDRVGCLADNVLTGLETGDIEFACYSAINYCDNLCLIGESLTVIHQKQTYYIELIESLKQEFQYFVAAIWAQFVENLMGMAVEPTQLVGQRFDESAQIPKLQETRAITSLFFVYTTKTMLNYLFNDYEQALIHSQSAINYEKGGEGMLPITQISLYRALVLLALYPTANPQRQTQILDEVKTHQQRLELWANHAPENFQHKLDLVAASKAKILSHREEAIELYDRAITGAKENEYIQEEALANELAAKFYLDWGKEKYAALHIQEAYYCYARWGAKAKIEDLEKRYPQLLQPILQQPKMGLTPHSISSYFSTNTIASTTDVVGLLDFATLMKAFRTLSRDIETERVIANLIQIIVENAGAETVALMLFNDNILILEAQMIDGEIDQKDSTPVEKTNQVPLEIVNTVKRTQMPVILDDARQETRYQGDPYIQNHQPLSLLCLPLQDRGKLRGILYLENNQSKGAFTEERVEVLSLLCAQAAITLENARLYQESCKALELERRLHELQRTQIQLIQSEKMFSLGQMVAGIAHEINNPISFIHGNIDHANEYMEQVLELLTLYQSHYPQPHQDIEIAIEEMDLEFLRSDFEKLLKSMENGSERIKNIVTSLRTFARLDESKLKRVDLHKGIESTLTILQNRLQKQDKRAEIQVVKDYGELPLVECYAGQLNQVFLNILNNAIDALEECEDQDSLTLHIRTETDGKQVKITFADNGVGMSEETQKQLFDPFFTTKEVGKGTGLGMAIAYQIITEKHGGMISCDSTVGQGTIFTIMIPR
ncbi:MAG: AAA family ATPase [Okeania sp. SIO3B5]|uniref:trifunctional serine/threonine-protein kinase/ATP-binding protein/sensor histidine kinase n=1 Tax=Okeania sp. SIO3B5 TaxID=2607811 RepID=UPI0014013E48|nr:ATP-binding sensor histidine kinase [Okeania sp. SIO3B5]NEO52296.1 AAA family ATPase [Okeania sp. SIO3B5]